MCVQSGCSQRRDLVTCAIGRENEQRVKVSIALVGVGASVAVCL